MRIGILTLHSQQNYGGLLQCYALQATLEGLGHTVVVIDRWMDRNRQSVWGLAMPRTVFAFFKLISNFILGRCWFAPYIRLRNTLKFMKQLNLTKFHFVDWCNAPQDLGVDVIVVGSDQVWNDWMGGAAAPYLLEGYPYMLPRVISYAASFGMKSIPCMQINLYKRGLSRFARISCREAEGVRICNELGFCAEHVVDPTILVDLSYWGHLLSYKSDENRCNQVSHRQLVCYIMSLDCDKLIPALEEFAIQQNCSVVLLTNTPYHKAIPRTARQLIRNYHNPFPHVKIASGYGPREFLNAFWGASWILTDSFHGVMFSTIFEKDLRIIKPDSEFRKAMFSRIDEFVEAFVSGPVLAATCEAALKSFMEKAQISYDRLRINKCREKSLKWLRESIGNES